MVFSFLDVYVTFGWKVVNWCGLCVCRRTEDFYLEEVRTKKGNKVKNGIILRIVCLVYLQTAAAAAIMYVLRHYKTIIYLA